MTYHSTVVCFLCIGIIISTLAILAIVESSKRKREDFNELGALGPYKASYYHCLSECEKVDPSLAMGAAKGSLMCADYCDSEMTHLVRTNGLGAGKAGSAGIPTPVLPMDAADEINRTNAWDIERYTTANEIDGMCQKECRYYSRKDGRCMDLCRRSLFGNFSLGWNWK